jgi:hypothetical protein
VPQRRLNQLARTVCEEDPRTLAQRRADAMGALAAGQESLACTCGSANCPAGESGSAPSNVVVHVVADATAVHRRRRKRSSLPRIGEAVSDRTRGYRLVRRDRRFRI